MRPPVRLLRWLGWIALSAVAALGVALSTVALLAIAPATRPAIASAIVKIVDEAIAGRLELEAVEVLARGGVEIRGLEVFDPEDRLVLSVGRARVYADVTGIAARALGVTVELDGPSVLLDEDPDGAPSLARAFAPARAPGARPGPREERGGGPGWTLHVPRIMVRQGDFWWVDADGRTRFQAQGIDLDARGRYGPGHARAELRVAGQMADPVAAPMLVELSASLEPGSLRVPVLRARLGGTSLEAVAEGDLERRSGRLAITRLGIDRDQVRRLAPETPAGDDLRATGYAESDGTVATASLHVEPAAEGAPGRVDAAAAARLASVTAGLGFDVVLDRLDPSRLIADAPAGSVNLAARGAASGDSFATLRARVTASMGSSRIRRGEVTHVDLRARAERGTIVVERATASAPGLSFDAALRWREGGDVSGKVALDAPDLSAVAANLGGLLGEKLPPAAGRARFEGTLAGTSAGPAIAATIDAPRVRYGGVTVVGARLEGEAAGPIRKMEGRFEGRVARVGSGGAEVATAVVLSGSLLGEATTVSATASLPGFRDPATVEASGRLGARRETLTLSQLSFGYPGARWALVSPATLTLAGPSVDRLALASGAQRISIEGGVGRRGALEARVQLERLDLARLPAGFVPQGYGLRGEFTGFVRASGTRARPEVEATFGVAGATFRNLSDLSAAGSATWSGAARRATASLASSVAGGTIDVRADLPFPLSARPREPVRVSAKVEGVRAGELLTAAASGAAVEGVLSLEAVLEGSAGMPAFRGAARLHDAVIEEIEKLALDVEIDEPGRSLRVSAGATLDGKRVLTARAEVPIDLADLLARPDQAMALLGRAPLAASATIAALDLSHLEGRAGFPDGIQGIVEGRASIEGSLEAPRGTVELELDRGAWAGYRSLSGRTDLTLGEQAVGLAVRLAIAGDDALRLEASLGAPIERLESLDNLRAVSLRAGAEIPKLALARVSAELPLSGSLEGKFEATGTLGAPRCKLALAGEGVSVEGRRLGDLRVDGRYESAGLTAEALLRPASGGELRVTLGVTADLGLGADRLPLAEAPAEATVFAEALDLAFLPALAPGVVRAGAGTLAVSVRARGPLARMSPLGTLRVKDGRISVSEFGDFTGIAVEAEVTEDAVEVPRVEVRRGRGVLSANASLRGLRSERARLEAHLSTEAFTVTRAGMDFATFDLQMDATGTRVGKVLSVEANVPRGAVRLPIRTPRNLQSLERRGDIVVGRREARRRAAPAAAMVGPPEEPYRLSARLVIPRGLFVKGDDPKVDVEIKADVRYDLIRSIGYAEGVLEVVRGEFEPIGGRKFVVERGRLQFTGGPPEQALLDFQARYDNPTAIVTVIVQGPVTKPEIRLSSQPPMDDGQIAMLIATGRTELKAGSGGVGTLTGEEAGRAALGALATQAFRNLVADKLPLDTVALESSAIRAGKYITNKIYVSYSRNFEADPEKGENVDEVRVEYQISPHWTFESRYGSAQSGGASLVWTKDY